MFSLRRPSGEVITRLLAAQRGEPFTYAAVGATATTPPKGYNVDRTRARIGQGDIAFQRAIAALRECHLPTPPIGRRGRMQFNSDARII